MPPNKLKSFLGTGWSFPPAFDRDAATVEMVSEEEDIRQSLFLLFSTTPGERLMKPEYGCDLQSLVFDQLNASTENRIVDLISTAVLRFEPRIRVEEITVDLTESFEGKIFINLIYLIRLTNSRENIVYPFYFKEGTNVRGM